MNIEDYRDFCLSLGNDVEEKLPFAKFKNGESVLVFYVCGHMFSFFDCNEFSVVSLKCQPERIEELKEEHSCVGNPYNESSKYWIGVDPTTAANDLLCDLTRNSYEIVKAKYAHKKSAKIREVKKNHTESEPQNVLKTATRSEFRTWLEANSQTESECWLKLKRGRPVNDGNFYYIDAVEEALCFGWIDSTHKEVGGVRMQRFSPRKKGSLWTELNKERVRRLEKLGLMTDEGRKVLPPMGKLSFKIDEDFRKALVEARVWTKFRAFPPLYQRIRAYNVTFYKQRNPASYRQSLAHLIDETANGRMFGEWNDYGRLLEY